MLAIAAISPASIAYWHLTNQAVVMSAGQERAAQWIDANTPHDAVFITDAFINSPVDLVGRRRIVTFPPYVSNLGYDPAPREADTRAIYCDGPTSPPSGWPRYGATYVLSSGGIVDCDGEEPTDFDAERSVRDGLRRRRRDDLASPCVSTTKRRRSRRRCVLPLFVALVALSADLRLVDLDRNPPELFEDELSGVVSAWSIATTGHDVEKTVLPFMVTRLEFKQPVYFLTTIPFQAVLRTLALAVRIPAVLFGVAATFLLVWLLAILRSGMRVALIGGFLFAISPWAIHYSRAAWEPASFLPFAMGGIGLLWLGITGPSARADDRCRARLRHRRLHVSPGPPDECRHGRDHRPDPRPCSSVGRPGRPRDRCRTSPSSSSSPTASPRRSRCSRPGPRGLSVFKDGVTADALGSRGRTSGRSGHRPSCSVAPPRTRGSTQDPLVYVWTVPFFIAGLDRLIHRRRREDLLLIAWLVVGALPAALTDDKTTPHAARGLLVLPALTAMTAIGIGRMLGSCGCARGEYGRGQRWRRGAALVAIAIVGVATFYRTYLDAYLVRSADFWGYGSARRDPNGAEHVPAGWTLCVATPDISGLTFAHHMALYLPSPPFRVVKGLADPVCKEPGTYLLALASRDLGRGVEPRATIPDIVGKPKFVVSQVSPTP